MSASGATFAPPAIFVPVRSAFQARAFSPRSHQRIVQRICPEVNLRTPPATAYVSPMPEAPAPLRMSPSPAFPREELRGGDNTGGGEGVEKRGRISCGLLTDGHRLGLVNFHIVASDSAPYDVIARKICLKKLSNVLGHTWTQNNSPNCRSIKPD